MNVYLISYNTENAKHVIAESIVSAISIFTDYFINDFVDIDSVEMVISDALTSEAEND